MYGKSPSIEVRSIMNIKKRGVSISEGHKEKICKSLAKLGPINTKSAKKVYLYSHDNPTVLFKEFRTYTEAGLFLGCHRKTLYRNINTNQIYKNKWLLFSNLIS